MHELGKGLVILGAVLLIIGLLLVFANKVPFFGKLPGDILIKRGNFTFYFPLTTGIIVSILVSLVLFLLGKHR
jgi:uncharacterized protein HemY